MDRLAVRSRGRKVAYLDRDGTTYRFRYLRGYLEQPGARPISPSLPLQEAPFEAERLFPFFEGLVSEGWLLEIQTRSGRIDPEDAFGLLMHNGEDLIGTVSLRREEPGD